MGTNTIYEAVDGVIEKDDINQYRTAVTGDFMPRNASSGALEGNQHSLGSSATPWKNAFINNLYINGILFDPSGTGGELNQANAVISGTTRTTSQQPDFLRASGSSNSLTILGATVPLAFSANSTSATIDTDLVVTSLTVAPSTNNTCLIANIDSDKTDYFGEKYGEIIDIESVGTEISDRVGQYVCFKTENSEYLLAYLKSTTEISNCLRGFFIDSSGSPIDRDFIVAGETLTLMSLGWIFVDINGTTIDVSYRSPIYSADEPTGAVTDDYWFDTVNQYWLRYSGSDWVQVDRTLVGWCVIDETNCVATRSLDFSKGYFDHNTINVALNDTETVYSEKYQSSISVYGNTFTWEANPIIWDITTDLETGLTEAANTVYYLYITETGDTIMSDKRPYDKNYNQKGYYHPHNSWRCVGRVYNNNLSDLENVLDIEEEFNPTIKEKLNIKAYPIKSTTDASYQNYTSQVMIVNNKSLEMYKKSRAGGSQQIYFRILSHDEDGNITLGVEDVFTDGANNTFVRDSQVNPLLVLNSKTAIGMFRLGTTNSHFVLLDLDIIDKTVSILDNESGGVSADFYSKLIKISNTEVMYLYSATTGIYYKIITISGSTLSIGTQQTLTTSATVINTQICSVFKNKDNVYICYGNKSGNLVLFSFTISGTTATFVIGRASASLGTSPALLLAYEPKQGGVHYTVGAGSALASAEPPLSQYELAIYGSSYAPLNTSYEFGYPGFASYEHFIDVIKGVDILTTSYPVRELDMGNYILSIIRVNTLSLFLLLINKNTGEINRVSLDSLGTIGLYTAISSITKINDKRILITAMPQASYYINYLPLEIEGLN